VSWNGAESGEILVAGLKEGEPTVPAGLMMTAELMVVFGPMAAAGPTSVAEPLI
jgi:hypothetical protein